jgi:dTDP-4-dehydrorhamnose 3,5-epimerase
MIFEALPLHGAFRIVPIRHEDVRGYFSRTFCETEFSARGLVAQYAQCSVSYNRNKGTLRGLHYQRDPFGETKIVRCVRGAIWDVIVDLRPSSSTYGKWYGEELSCRNGASLYVPSGFAHGFQTISDDAEVYYQISVPFEATAATGIVYSDPFLGVQWPLDVTVISERDRNLPHFRTMR